MNVHSSFVHNSPQTGNNPNVQQQQMDKMWTSCKDGILLSNEKEQTMDHATTQMNVSKYEE